MPTTRSRIPHRAVRSAGKKLNEEKIQKSLTRENWMFWVANSNKKKKRKENFYCKLKDVKEFNLLLLLHQT